MVVLRRFVTLAVSFCLVLAIGLTWVDPLFAQGDAQERRSAARKAEAPRKKPPRPTRPRREPAKKDEPAKTEAPKADGTPAASDPAGGPGQDRRRPQGRGRGDRRRPGRRAGGDLDRPAADPRHPDHRPRDRRADLEEHDGQEALRRQPRGLRRVVHRLRQDSRASTTRRTFGSSTPAPGSSSGTTSVPASWSSTSRRSARPRARRRRPRRTRPSRRKPRRPTNRRRPTSPRSRDRPEPGSAAGRSGFAASGSALNDEADSPRCPADPDDRHALAAA